MKVLRGILYGLNVEEHGLRRANKMLEFIQHPLAKIALPAPALCPTTLD
jgi:hypothetical protein